MDLREEPKFKCILLTGGAGFIGSHVVDELVRQHIASTVVVVDILSPVSTMKNVSKDVTFIHADYGSYHHMKHLLSEYEVDAVMHFGAYSHVDDSFNNPVKFTQNNVLGTHYLLEACRAYGKLLKFLHVSTDEVYGGEAKGDETFHTESILNPTNPYAASKAAAEMLAWSYWKSYGLPVLITRGNNVYGPRQHPEKLIPQVIQRMFRNEPVHIHGSGEQQRSFLHVYDVARAFVVLLCRGKVGERYNLGTPTEYTVNQVVKDLQALIPESKSEIKHVVDRQINDQRYPITSSKLEQLGWKAWWQWSSGLKKTVSWYRQNPDWHTKE